MYQREIILNGVRSGDMKILVRALAAVRKEYSNQPLTYYDATGEKHEERLSGTYYRADGEAIDSGTPYMLFYEKDKSETPYKAFKVDSEPNEKQRLLDMTGRVIVCNHTDVDFSVFLEQAGKED